MKIGSLLFILLVVCPFFGNAKEVELVNVAKPLDQVEQSYLRNVASVVTDTEIKTVSSPAQLSFDEKELVSIIDADQASGVSLAQKAEYQFLISTKTINRLSKMTITGDLDGAFVSVQLAEMPLSPGENGWKFVVKNKPLQSPATAFQFRSQAAFRVLVTIRTSAAQVKTPPTLCGIACYTFEDVRELKLEKNPNKKDQPETEKVAKDSSSDGGSPESLYDIGGMSAGARVAFISSSVDSAKVNSINDDDADSYAELNPKEEETVVVLDLQESRRVQKIGIVHSQQAGELAFYVVDQLPWITPTRDAKKLTRLEEQDDLIIESDVPRFTLGQLPPQTAQQTIRVKPDWLETLTPFGTIHADNEKFSNLKGASTEGRYIILRFLNHSTDSTGGFRIYGVNIFGDYKRNDFVLVPKSLPEVDGSALIATPTPPAATGPSGTLEGPPSTEINKVKALLEPPPLVESPLPLSPSVP